VSSDQLTTCRHRSEIADEHPTDPFFGSHRQDMCRSCPGGLREIAACAFADDVAILPSGAGGGDIVLCIGEQPACEAWHSRLAAAGLTRLAIRIGAPGVHRVIGPR
jgi:hypothetical protein